MVKSNYEIETKNRKRLRILVEIEGYNELLQFQEKKSLEISRRIESLVDKYNEITSDLGSKR